ncbi:hypothetical protein JS562_55240 [Agrobacterium sp. S2]|nr:hypothetical protein [Agrobacterium sp. S2]
MVWFQVYGLIKSRVGVCSRGKLDARARARFRFVTHVASQKQFTQTGDNADATIEIGI